MTYILYGIPSCDTMKKARAWLDEHGVVYDFHNYKILGIDRARLENWCSEHGWEVILNCAGTTFRKLDDEQKTGLDTTKAIALMMSQPSMIKRPVLDLGNCTIVGFKPVSYQSHWSNKRISHDHMTT